MIVKCKVKLLVIKILHISVKFYMKKESADRLKAISVATQQTKRPSDRLILICNTSAWLIQDKEKLVSLLIASQATNRRLTADAKAMTELLAERLDLVNRLQSQVNTDQKLA